MEYPKRVRVVYADGAEEMGLAIDAGQVDVGPMGLQVKLREIVHVDGVPKLVAGFGKQSGRDAELKGIGPLPSEEKSVRLKLKDVPTWWTAEERKKR